MRSDFFVVTLCQSVIKCTEFCSIIIFSRVFEKVKWRQERYSILTSFKEGWVISLMD